MEASVIPTTGIIYVPTIDYKNTPIVKWSKLCIVHLNIQSLNSKVAYVNMLASIESPDVLCLSEHHLPQVQIEKINFSSMFLASNYSRVQNSRGGACILVASKWSDYVRSRPDLMAKNCEFHFETSVVEFTKLNTIVICVYRSPGRGSRVVFLELLDWVLGQIACEGKDAVVAGDFNYHFLTPHDSRPLTDLMCSYQLQKAINVPTRGKECLDNFFTNLSFQDEGVFESGVSDHKGIMLTLKVKFAGMSLVAPHIRRKINVQNLCSLFSCANWQDLYLTNDINVMFNCFIQRFQTALDLTCPLSATKAVRTTSNTSPELIALFTELKDINILIGSCTDQNLKSGLRRRYRGLKKKVESAVKRVNDEKIRNSENISRGAWSVVKGIVNTKNVCPGPKKLVVNGNLVNRPEQMAKEFITHFSNLPTPPVSNLSPISIMSSVTTSPVNSFFISPVTEDELGRFCSSIKNSKSQDVYEMSAYLLKNCWPVLGEVLTHLVNASIMSGVFPDCLKDVEVVPVFKKGDKTVLKNWRAISMCPILSKLIEKVVCDRLMSFLSRNMILCPQQFGFRKKLSTSDALFSFLSTLYERCDLRETVGGVFCDLSRAFETVPFCTLLQKLQFYGIRGLALNFFSTYLRGRKQRVRLRDQDNGEKICSEWAPVNSGVPAGSVLGPALFILFVNDISGFMSAHCRKCTLFADDTSLIVSGPRNADISHLAELAIRRAQVWFDANQLMLNSDKTEIVNFTKINPLNTLHINGQDVEASSCVKFLGLTVNQSLSWTHHIDILCSRLMSNLYLLRTLSRQIGVETLKLVYHSCFESHLVYGIIFWYGSPGVLIDKVFKIQKRAIRTMFRLHPRTHCSQYFRDSNIMTLPALYTYHMLMFVRKNFDKFVLKESRDGRVLRGLRVHFESFRHSPQYRAIALFNGLERGLRDEECTNTFRNTLKKALIEAAPYSVPFSSSYAE